MRFLIFISLLLISIASVNAQSDAIRAAWNEAKDLCNENDYLTAKPHLLTVYQEMPRPLCCYWLGMAYDLENKRDSAAFYYKASIDNSSKPQLAAWDNLIRVYLRQLDFDRAYATAWKAMQKYPGNPTFIEEFKEVCKWSYFIHHLNFDKQYLTSTAIKKEYPIKTITEQYLIVKNIRNDKGQRLHIQNRQYKGTYEVWKASFNNSKESFDIKFNLGDHDLDRQLEKQHEEAKAVYNDKEQLIHIRLGALLALLPISDKQMLDLLAAEEEAVRLCTCTEVNSTTSKKVKKKCLSDASEMVKTTCENFGVYKK